MSQMNYSQAAAQALSDAMTADPSVVVLGEDVGRGGVFAQYKGLLDKFGASRVIDTPISEATIMGSAVGMALTGLRPVVELRVIDFALCAIDEIVNQAAKNRFMFGGQGRVPTVIRMPIGVWAGSAAQHSQSLEAWFAHIPGLVVVAPGSPQDNYSLLRAALASDDPVIYLEHKEMWGTAGEVDVNASGDIAQLGKARIVRDGSDLTIVTWSRAVQWACEAAEDLQTDGISAQVIDLRSLWPWDKELVASACAATGRLLVVHEAVQTAGYGAEIAATMAEQTGVRIARLGAPRLPAGYAPNLEAIARIDGPKIAARVRQWLSSQSNECL
ncbi:MAG: transketolase C-terminal domain-containing protein [Burkholderiaceae bacterium]